MRFLFTAFNGIVTNKLASLLIVAVILFVFTSVIVNRTDWRSAFTPGFIKYLVYRPLHVLFPESNLISVDASLFPLLFLSEQEDFLQNYAKKEGAIKTRDFLLNIYPSQPAWLHDMGHIIGEAMYEEFDKRALGNCDSTFSFSCYHGVILAFLRENGLDKKATEQFAYTGCISEPNEEDKHGCYHGFGHALMVVNNNDVPDSMKDCDAYVRDKQFSFDCYQGVAMENAQGSFSEGDERPFLNEEDPYYPCRILDRKYQGACYSEHVVHAAHIFQDDWGKISNYCASLPEVGSLEKELCFARIGGSIFQSKSDVRRVSEVCHYNSQYAPACMINFARHRAFAKDWQSAREACDALLGEAKIQCHEFISVIQKQRAGDLSLKEIQQLVEVTMEKEGPLGARDMLKAMYPDQPSSFHEVVHIIGEELYKTYKEGALALCDSSFFYACYHGVIISYMRTEGLNKKKMVGFIHDGCVQSLRKKYDILACFHGMGHAFMLANRNDVPLSMGDCDNAIAKEQTQRREFCYQGVAMENAQGFNTREARPYIKREDLYYPCNTLEKRHQSVCYAEQVALVLRDFYPLDWEKAAEYCANIPQGDKGYITSCFNRIGITLDGFTRGNVEEVGRLCGYNKEYEAQCLIGFARQRLFEGDNKKALAACDLLKGNYHTRCQKDIDALILEFEANNV